jgi:hypothetical protein
VPNPYKDILTQLENNQAILFLGSGSTAQCRRSTDGAPGLTGWGLSKAILEELARQDGFPISDNHIPPLMESAEYFQSNHPGGRASLDKFVQERLKFLAPTLGHYLATSFPWKAVITTNYNTVAEDAWKAATAQGYAAKEVLVIRTDGDIDTYAGETTKIRLYKPHGCVDLQMSPDHRMVITSQDYAESERIRKNMYTAIKSLASTSTTVFVGYSLADYTFRNLYYSLFVQLGVWAQQSYATNPMESDLLFQWKSKAMLQLNTTLINTNFDPFMLHLVKQRGTLAPKLKGMIKESWDEVYASNKDRMDGLKLKDFTSLPARLTKSPPPKTKTARTKKK